MRIALAQQNYHIGNFEKNTGKIISAIQQAREAGAELVVFSELSVCGYPPRDFLEFDDFLNQCNTSIEQITQHSDDIGVIIGAPQKNLNPLGKDRSSELKTGRHFLLCDSFAENYSRCCLPQCHRMADWR